MLCWVSEFAYHPQQDFGELSRAVGESNILTTRNLRAFAFHELNLHRITLTAFEYNRPSIALAEKLGFRREGVFREFLQRDGQRHDMLLFGLLRHEWQDWNKG